MKALAFENGQVIIDGFNQYQNGCRHALLLWARIVGLERRLRVLAAGQIGNSHAPKCRSWRSLRAFLIAANFQAKEGGAVRKDCAASRISSDSGSPRVARASVNAPTISEYCTSACCRFAAGSCESIN
ncbi:hypothetical protein D3C76_1322210 [compost metagenome]